MKSKRTKLSKAERSALKAVQRKLASEFAARFKELSESAAFTARRQRAAAKFKQRLFDKAMAAAGIDLEAIARRQKRDQAAILAFADRRKKQALRRAPASLQRHVRELAIRANRWADPQPPGFGAVIDLVDTAALIDVYPPESADFERSIAPQLNIARIKVAATNDSGFLGYFGYRGVDWSFIWTPPRDGLLNVITFLSMIGGSWLIVDSDCGGGTAFAIIEAGIKLHQVGAGDESSPRVRLLDQRLSAGGAASLGDVDGVNFNDLNTLTMSQLIPVSANVPVVVTVQASLWVHQSNGQAEVNFYHDSARLNVPFVQLVLH